MGPPRLTSFFADALAYSLGLEVVIVSLTATIDEELARAVFLIIPPTGEISQTVARVFWQATYICRESPGLRTQECNPEQNNVVRKPQCMNLEQNSFPSHTLGVQHHEHIARTCWEMLW